MRDYHKECLIKFVIISMPYAVLITLAVSGWIKPPHEHPRPSVEHVQCEINKAKPEWDTPLIIDGVAGTKTVQDWMFYSPSWNAENERRLCK